jgi:hypothetical protein
MKTGYGTTSKSQNWIMLKHGMMEESSKVTDEMCDNCSKALPGASVKILKELYTTFHRKKLRQRPPGMHSSTHRKAAVAAASRSPTKPLGSLWEQEQQNMLRRTEHLHFCDAES